MKSKIEGSPRHSWRGIRRTADRQRRGMMGFTPVLSMAIGAALLLTGATATAQVSRKQNKVECTGAGAGTCTFTTFLVQQDAGTAADCTRPRLCETAAIAAPTNSCDAADATIANTFGAAACAAQLGVQPGSIVAIPSKSSAGGVVPGFTFVELAAFTPTRFWQVCMQDNSGAAPVALTGAAINNARVTGPFPPVTMCGLTFRENKKLKMDSPAVPAVGVVVLALGLAAGGLLLRRRTRAAS